MRGRQIRARQPAVIGRKARCASTPSPQDSPRPSRRGKTPSPSRPTKDRAPNPAWDGAGIVQASAEQLRDPSADGAGAVAHKAAVHAARPFRAARPTHPVKPTRREPPLQEKAERARKRPRNAAPSRPHGRPRIASLARAFPDGLPTTARHRGKAHASSRTAPLRPRRSHAKPTQASQSTDQLAIAIAQPARTISLR